MLWVTKGNKITVLKLSYLSSSELLLKTVAPTCVWLPIPSTERRFSPPIAPRLWSQWKVSCHMLGINSLFHISQIQHGFCEQNFILLHPISSEVVSKPDISFAVFKDSHNYSAMVTCQSTKGTPPVTFSLYRGTELVTKMAVDERHATFQVPLILGQHLGWFKCQANNGDQTAYSKEIPLEFGMCIVWNNTAAL